LYEVPKAETWLIKNVQVWTNVADSIFSQKLGITPDTTGGILRTADVLISDGKIQQVGKQLSAPNAQIIDGKGLHLTPGIIDEHSHIAIERGVNEGTQAITAEVRIGDAVRAEDLNIFRQLAGGVTTSQLLHGSANPIGGQSAIIKLRWGMPATEMIMKEAPPFIKFALGENVKQSNWGDRHTTRFPQSRPGVEQIIEDGFQRALVYEQAQKAGGTGFRRDLELETLVEILRGKRFITCHSYVQSEITMLMRLAEKYNFRINTFTHVLEGYKIADKIKAHGASASSFSDWWAYKYEVIDAIPYNGALLTEAGVNTGFNSDDAEMGRRLNQEAAKAVKYGGLSEAEALKLVTLNPAKMLKIDALVGSIEPGKQADVVLWSDHPLSVYARAMKTWVDGKLFYDVEKLPELQTRMMAEKEWLLQRARQAGKNGTAEHSEDIQDNYYHCETLEQEAHEYSR
jgi:imidazolonepropionase-like amidohydrolase